MGITMNDSFQRALLASVREYCVEIEDTAIDVIRFGTGKRNLAILPGISLTALSGSGAGIAAAYAVLAQDYTVYLPDPRPRG